jgi:hypothetical protein
LPEYPSADYAAAGTAHNADTADNGTVDPADHHVQCAGLPSGRTQCRTAGE